MTDTDTQPIYGTREAWLEAAIEELKALFPDEYDVPSVRVSVGWPGGRGNKQSVIGQCWASCASDDGRPQIFISPVLVGPVYNSAAVSFKLKLIDEDPEEKEIQVTSAQGVLPTLLHELCHAVVDCEDGHRGRFAKVAKAVGLTGKMTCTHAGEGLVADLEALAERLGAYPHAQLGKLGVKGSEEPKKQGTRMLKLACPSDGYIVRTTRKWIDELGLPSCPCGLPLEESEPTP